MQRAGLFATRDPTARGPTLDAWLDVEELDGFTVFEDVDIVVVPEPTPFAPPEWRKRAGCRTVGYDVMSDPNNVEGARSICESCPVRVDCLRFVLDNEDTEGVWAGLTFEERTRVCPVCLGPKEPQDLGCDFAHNLARLVRLSELQEMGAIDVRVSMRQKPTARTFADCPVPRGMSHSSSHAYKDGCRCLAARQARREERNGRDGREGQRGDYRVRETV